MKKRLAISFSGGRTSAIMTKKCLEQYKDDFDIVVTFANTGCEHNATLDFVRDCDKYWNFNIVWLEAVVNPEKGKGIRARVTDYENAYRWDQWEDELHPFHAAVRKYGIFNKQNPSCTGRLKEEVMYAYLRDYQGWGRGSYYTAIGIRSDESDRMSTRSNHKFIYPLVKLGYSESMVKKEMECFSHDLKIPGDHYGNCVTCWKKSTRKLMTIAKNSPEYFVFMSEMEKRYPRVKVNKGYEDRVFFRDKKSAQWILDESKKPFKEYCDTKIEDFQPPLFSESLDDWIFWDKESSCGSSCEIGADE